MTYDDSLVGGIPPGHVKFADLHPSLSELTSCEEFVRDLLISVIPAPVGTAPDWEDRLNDFLYSRAYRR